MENSKEVLLPSGRRILISLPPFEQSKALYQAILEEVKGVKIGEQDEVHNLVKDMICTMGSSKKIEAALWPCLERSAYEGQRVTKSSFESVEAREDYFDICYEVANENIRPFLKTLMREFSPILGRVKSSLA